MVKLRKQQREMMWGGKSTSDDTHRYHCDTFKLGGEEGGKKLIWLINPYRDTRDLDTSIFLIEAGVSLANLSWILVNL